ncbi:MAG: hypothetical protein R2867_02415 [Caldilineaceae bacterium]
MTEIFSSLFQSFKLVAVLPAFLFVHLNYSVFYSAISGENIWSIIFAIHSSDNIVAIIILSFLIGYFLSILNLPLIRFFEGYPWRGTYYGRFFTDLQIQRKKKLFDVVEQVDKEIDRLEIQRKQYLPGHPLREDIFFKIEMLKRERDVASSLTQRTELLNFPVSRAPFLPTVLGNVIAAFEDYPYKQYGIDSVIMWPRLIPTLTKEKFSIYVDNEKSKLDFMINLCVLSVLFAIELAYIGLIFADNYKLWLISAGFTGLCSYFVFYKCAILSAVGWGNTIRVAFDLHRYQLLSKLYIRIPKDKTDEEIIWKQISQVFREQEYDYKRNPILDYARIYTAVMRVEESGNKGG